MDKILAIVPAYNEEANIVSTIEDLMTNAPNVDYVIIDDGSKDSTLQICEERGYRFLSLPINLGLSGAFQTGMRYALEKDYEYVVQFDADGQHSASFISVMVDAAREQNVDIIIGSRFFGKRKPFSARMVGSSLITFMILLTTGQKIQDPTSGMRLFSKKLIKDFANELDYGPEPDTVSLLLRNGSKVAEVPVEMRERTAGESYLNFRKSLSYMLRICISILFVQWFRGPK